MKAIAVAILVAACGGEHNPAIDARPIDVPGDAMPREVVMENVPLVVTEVVEAIMKGAPTDYAHITMSANGATFDWNLHGHANGGTQVVTEAFDTTSVDYVFIPPATGDWYLLIRNLGQTDITLKLRIELYNNLTWSGWQ